MNNIIIHKLPLPYTPDYLVDMFREYLDTFNFKALPELLLRTLQSIPSIEYYILYNGRQIIGYLSGSVTLDTNTWLIDTIYLKPSKRRYFKGVIIVMEKILLSRGIRGWVDINNIPKITNMYNKHNICERIDICPQ